MNMVFIANFAGSPNHGTVYAYYNLAKEWVMKGHNITIIADAFAHNRHNKPQVKKQITEECYLRRKSKFRFWFVMRENNLVNTTRGVIPIMTPYVGDYSSEFNGCVYVVEDDDVALNVERLRSLLLNPDILHNDFYNETSAYTWKNCE